MNGKQVKTLRNLQADDKKSKRAWRKLTAEQKGILRANVLAMKGAYK